MRNIFAHTDLGHYPAYFSINKDNGGRYLVIVRSAGNAGRDTGTIVVSQETLERMATDVLASLNSAQPTTHAVARVTPDIVAFTYSEEDGAWAHVTAPDGKQYGVSLAHLAEKFGDSIEARWARAIADRVREG